MSKLSMSQFANSSDYWRARAEASEKQCDALASALCQLKEAVENHWGTPKSGATHPKYFDVPMAGAYHALQGEGE